ncbi:hypothetical protein, partial [Nocardia cyriacigeorgica]|uniref:hypothetical protein n=1 Tax=Nocardia cyriacigeorgica TaxID=135487 RepID=UPI002454733D
MSRGRPGRRPPHDHPDQPKRIFQHFRNDERSGWSDFRCPVHAIQEAKCIDIVPAYRDPVAGRT